MEQMEKIVWHLGPFFDKDAFQRGVRRETTDLASAQASAPALATSASVPMSARTPVSGSNRYKTPKAEPDREYFATWVGERLKEMPKNDHQIKMRGGALGEHVANDVGSSNDGSILRGCLGNWSGEDSSEKSVFPLAGWV